MSGRLGHSNAATTLGVYAHSVEASDQDAAELLGQLLAKAGADQDAPRHDPDSRPGRPVR